MFLLRKFKALLLVDTLREIKKSLGRFLSLIFLTFLGVGCFVGFRVSVPLMHLWMDSLLHEQRIYDIKIQSVFGFSPEALQQIQSLNSNLVVQGGYAQEVSTQYTVTEVLGQSFSQENLNQLLLLEGRFPQHSGECLLHPSYSGKNIGDTVTITLKSHDSTSFYEENVQEYTLEVVGIANSPLYLSAELGTSTLGTGKINQLLFVDESLFLEEYHHIYLSFSSISPETVPSLLEEIQSEGEAIWSADAVPYLSISKNYVENLRQTLEEEVLYQENYLLTLQDQVELARGLVSDGWKTFEENKTWLSQGDQTQAKAELSLLEENYNTQLVLQQEAETQGEFLLTQLKKDLEQAERNDHILNNGHWVFESQEDNGSYQAYSLDALQLRQLANAFPLIFFTITALVCFATMVQIVEEQRNTIGTLRSLGYSVWSIMGKYLNYALLVWFFGGFLGLFAGLYLIPQIIYRIWSQVYLMGNFQWQYFPEISGSAVGFAMVVLVVSTIFACLSIISSYPASLLQDKAPKPGGKIFLEYSAILWHDLTFHQKITLRNVFRNFPRFLFQVFTIGAVTGVAVSAFGMGTALSEAIYRQYYELYFHTTQVFLREDVTTEERLEVHGVLASYGLSQEFTSFSSHSVTASHPEINLWHDTKVYTVENDGELDKVLYLRQNKWLPYYMPDTGAIVPLKLAEELQLELGDYITLEGDFGTVDAKITALSEFYTEQTIIMSHFYFEWLTGSPPDINEIWVDYTGMKDWYQKSNDLSSDLLALDGTIGISHRSEERSSYTNGIQTTEYTILFMILSSIVLVYGVLYYLNNHNMSRRKGEIATLKVLGLNDQELSAYLYKENIIVTFYGLALGMVIGQNFHHWLVRSMELPDMMLFRGVYIMSYINAIAFVMILAIIVNVQMYFTLQKLNMTQELRGTRE